MLNEYCDDNQKVTISDIGGVITDWKYRGVPIFYPRVAVGTRDNPKFRGGMHPCYPNFGTVDPRFGLPQHGPLRMRTADAMDRTGILFQGTDLLGSTCTVQSEVKSILTLRPKGFRYRLLARLLESTPTEAFINPGFHPYFCTPTGSAHVCAMGESTLISGLNVEPQYLSMNKGVDVMIPKLGSVCMTVGNGWMNAKERKIALWRDSEKYLCVEPIFGEPEQYGGPSCFRLTTEWFEMSCDFEVTLYATQ